MVYRNYEINIGATERRDGEMVTEACVSINYQPLHSIFVFLGQNELALEKAQRWIDEQGAKTAPSIDTPTYKSITYDHGDYRAELDGRLIGYYPNHHAAEVALDELVYDMLTHGDTETAQALNGSQPSDAELVEQAEAVLPRAMGDKAVYVTFNDQTNRYNVRNMNTSAIVASASTQKEANRICKSKRYQVYGITCYE